MLINFGTVSSSCSQVKNTLSLPSRWCKDLITIRVPDGFPVGYSNTIYRSLLYSVRPLCNFTSVSLLHSFCEDNHELIMQYQFEKQQNSTMKNLQIKHHKAKLTRPQVCVANYRVRAILLFIRLFSFGRNKCL